MSKTILITGASKGIGFALAQQFLNNGYSVIGTSRTGEIENLSHLNFTTLKLDLSEQETIIDFDKILESRNIEIDFLINNAGIGPDLDTLTPDKDSFKQTFDVNVTGTVFFTELLCKRIKNGGKIINISSKMGSIELCERIDSVAYRMSKTALNMYSKILTNRLLDKQTIATIHPGWVRTTIAKDNIVNGRLSADESAIKIFNFVTSNFDTGIFWDIEAERKTEW
ncbi:SDR family NAD(P)-dependent oxidoreductase [Epilithonimonas hominis]|uniref:SDR family NAD(P)-dependent oxidoreductase n=1 Tax=Epilithonimonas hominis TaxID=420404 RepID=UPI00289D9C9B|nr:SDR family NAD(P)-dependent oxidoreductase [Epilithonimonas hominis]